MRLCAFVCGCVRLCAFLLEGLLERRMSSADAVQTTEHTRRVNVPVGFEIIKEKRSNTPELSLQACMY